MRNMGSSGLGVFLLSANFVLLCFVLTHVVFDGPGDVDSERERQEQQLRLTEKALRPALDQLGYQLRKERGDLKKQLSGQLSEKLRASEQLLGRLRREQDSAKEELLRQINELRETGRGGTGALEHLSAEYVEGDYEVFDFSRWEKVQEERVALFRKGCKMVPPYFVDNEKIYIRENMFLFKDFGLSYCHMPKTGSTTVVNHFQQVFQGYAKDGEANKQNMFNAFQFLTDNYGIDGGKVTVLDAFSRVKTFIMVRHPFVRLVSAYRMRGHFLSDEISARFNLKKEHTAEFKYFIDFYLENDEQFKRVYSRDKHYRTISGQCDVCRLGVDFVGKMETFDWELLFLKEKFGVPFEHLEVKRHVRKGDSSEDLTKEWFATITKAQIRRLYEIYQVDFVLYGYGDADDYIALGKGD